MDAKSSIEKVRSRNWQTWKFQLKYLVKAKGLWGYVTGGTVLAAEAGDQARNEFNVKCDKAFATIVLYVPKLSGNLVSVGACIKKKNVIEITDEKCYIKDNSGRVLGEGHKVSDKLFSLNLCKSQYIRLMLKKYG